MRVHRVVVLSRGVGVVVVDVWVSLKRGMGLMRVRSRRGARGEEGGAAPRVWPRGLAAGSGALMRSRFPSTSSDFSGRRTSLPVLRSGARAPLSSLCLSSACSKRGDARSSASGLSLRLASMCPVLSSLSGRAEQRSRAADGIGFDEREMHAEGSEEEKPKSRERERTEKGGAEASLHQPRQCHSGHAPSVRTHVLLSSSSCCSWT